MTQPDLISDSAKNPTTSSATTMESTPPGAPNKQFIDCFNKILTAGQAAALIAVAVAALYGVGESVLSLFSDQTIQIGMLLMIFLYVEILSMVKGARLGIREIPIHTPIALAIVAVARYLMVDVEHIDALYIMYTSGAILILVLSLWLVRRSERGNDPY